MTEVILRLIVLGLALAGMKLGIWTAAHPDRFLNVFNPYLKPYSNKVLSFTRGVGLLWLFVSTYGSVGAATSIVVSERFSTVRTVLAVAGFVIAMLVTVHTFRRKPAEKHGE
jgi:hypothetical protein